MSYELTFEPRAQFLFCLVTGEDSYETSLAYWRQIAQKCDELGLTKVLVVEDLEGQLSEMEIFQLCSQFPKIGLMKKRIAFVDRNSSHDHGNEFGVTVANNRGTYGRLFSRVEYAEKWLLKD